MNKNVQRSYSDDLEVYYINGDFHREDGPAAKRTNGEEMWCLNGKFHRVDGPAVKLCTGIESYYLNNLCFSKLEYKITSILLKINMFYE